MSKAPFPALGHGLFLLLGLGWGMGCFAPLNRRKGLG
jgi:hypothetical protein